MNNNLVELTQEEIQEVAGAGYVADIVNLIGNDVVKRLGSAIVSISDKWQSNLNEKGNTWIAGLVKIIL